MATHTSSHKDLTTFSSARVDRELSGSEAAIEAITGHWPRTMAYPFGAANPRVVDRVAACQPMLMAVLSGKGTQETWAGRFTVPRIQIGPDSTVEGLVTRLNKSFGSSELGYQ